MNEKANIVGVDGKVPFVQASVPHMVPPGFEVSNGLKERSRQNKRARFKKPQLHVRFSLS